MAEGGAGLIRVDAVWLAVKPPDMQHLQRNSAKDRRQFTCARRAAYRRYEALAELSRRHVLRAAAHPPPMHRPLRHPPPHPIPRPLHHRLSPLRLKP